MIALNRRTNIYVAKGPTDMRASYDTLSLKARDILRQDPFSGHLFVFLNARRTSCKCLYYDGTGLVIIAKRLEKGLFSKINPYLNEDIILTQAEFNLFFGAPGRSNSCSGCNSHLRKEVASPLRIESWAYGGNNMS
jgi:transposase